MRKTKKMKYFLLGTVLTVGMICTACGKKTVENETYRNVKIDSVKGNVTVDREEKMDAVDGMMLVPDDNVVVDKGAETVLLADSDKHIYANENSSFSVYSDGDVSKGKIKIDVEYGDLRFVIENKLSQDSEFTVTTPNAVLSVRGTTFQVAYDKENDITLVAVEEGIVYADYKGHFENEEIKAGELRIIDKDGVVNDISSSKWDNSFSIYDLGNEEATESDLVNEESSEYDSLTFADGTVATDACLEYKDMYVDFQRAPEIFPGARIEKRSTSNVVIYFNEGTDKEYSVQYSTGYGDYSKDSTRDATFKNGYEEMTLGNDIVFIYTLEEEENGTRAIIMQKLKDEEYVSIRAFNKTGMDNIEFVKRILVKSYYTIWGRS